MKALKVSLFALVSILIPAAASADALVAGARNVNRIVGTMTGDAASLDNSVAGNDLAGLSFPLVSGRAYIFQCTLAYITTTTTIGLTVDMTWPGAAATYVYWGAFIQGEGAAGTAHSFQGFVNTASGTVASGNVNTNTNIYPIFIHGVVKPSSSGNATVRVASESGTGITVKTGSSCWFAED